MRFDGFWERQGTFTCLRDATPVAKIFENKYFDAHSELVSIFSIMNSPLGTSPFDLSRTFDPKKLHFQSVKLIRINHVYINRTIHFYMFIFLEKVNNVN